MGKGESSNPETSQQVALSKVATEQWNRYQDTFVPFTNKYIQDVSGLNVETGAVDKTRTEAQQAKVAGQINASMAQAIPTNAPSRVDPSQARYLSGVGNADVVKSTAKAQVKGAQSVKDKQIEAMMSAVSLGRGQADDTQTGMEDLASQAVQEQIEDTRAKRETQNAITSSVGTAAGAGAALYSNWGSGTTTAKQRPLKR